MNLADCVFGGRGAVRGWENREPIRFTPVDRPITEFIELAQHLLSIPRGQGPVSDPVKKAVNR